LYYRVNVLPIRLPPLRERPGDIDLLIDHWLPAGWHVEAEARRVLNSYPWPGNVRELINVIQRATILADNDEITLDDLPRELNEELPSLSKRTTMEVVPPLIKIDDNADRLDDVAKAHVLEVLEKQGGNKAKAARVLGIHRRKLYRLLERFQEPVGSPTCDSSEAIFGSPNAVPAEEP
jgi:DNA-binding NtrC family response regulator